MNIEIRKLKKSDVESVADLYVSVIDSNYISYAEINEGLAKDLNTFSTNARKQFVSYLRKISSNKSKEVFVASLGTKIFGFIYVEIKKAKAGYKECWINDLGVDVKFRKKGIAKMLMQKAYEFGAKNKIKYFALESGIKNTQAHKLFEKEGFCAVNTIFLKPIRK